MKHLRPSHLFIHLRLPVLAGVLALPLLSACTSEKRDRLWRTLDPAGYKHSHSASFHPEKYHRGPPPSNLPAADDVELDITR